MYQKDYILRVAEEMGKVIGIIIGLKKEGKWEDALEAIDIAYKDLLKLDPKIADDIPEEKIIDHLLNKLKLQNEQLAVVADLLREEGEILYQIKKTGEGKVKLAKALKIYHYLNEQETKTFSLDRAAKIASIQAMLNNFK